MARKKSTPNSENQRQAKYLQTGIYEIVNMISGKRYIGSAVNVAARWKKHCKDLNDGKHHSRHLQSAWNSYGADAFVFNRLLICARPILIRYEQICMDAYRPAYNMTPTAGSVLGMKHSEATIEKMRRREFTAEHRANISAAPRPPCSEETRKKLALVRTGTVASAETKLKLSAARVGKKPSLGVKHSDETRRQQSERMKANPTFLGKTHSDEMRAKISKARKGQPTGYHQTPAHKQKLREYSVGNKIWLGRNHSSESIEKMSKAQMGRTFSDETRALMSKVHSGTKASDETRARMRAAHQGRVCSDEFKLAVREGIARGKARRADALTRMPQLDIFEDED